MGYRLSKITTRTGDDGKTHLGDNIRLPKDHIRIEAIGTIDELNSVIGVVLSEHPKNKTIVNALIQIQNHLFDLGGELCPPYHLVITAEKTLTLETLIENLNATLPPLKEFILPGGNKAAALCHVARTVCRRAERALVKLHHEELLNLEILRYINRLSDLLFILARCLTKESNQNENYWEHTRKKE